MSDNAHFQNLQAEEQQRAHEREVQEAFAEREGNNDDISAEYADGEQPGHLGNDTSGMSLLETNLEELTQQEREPNEDVRQALEDLKDLNFRDAIEEADR